MTKKKYNSEEIKNSLRKKVDLFTKENTKKMKRNYMYQIIDGVNNLKTLNKFIKEEKRNV